MEWPMAGWKRLALKGVAAVALAIVTATAGAETFEIGGRGSDAKQFRQLLTEGRWQAKLIRPTAEACQSFWIGTEAAHWYPLTLDCFSGGATFRVLGAAGPRTLGAGPVRVKPNLWSFTPERTEWRLRFTKVGSDCEPTHTLLSLDGGYSVEMCFEYEDDQGRAVTRDARSYGLASRQSGLLYFFDRDNAEVLVKVLNGCAVNGHRWVYVAPVTDLAFKLAVRAGRGSKVWTYENPKGSPARVRSDLNAFYCPESDSAALVETTVRRAGSLYPVVRPD
jgi:hypothetical protein